MRIRRSFSDPAHPTPVNGTPTPIRPMRPVPPRRVFHQQDPEAPRGFRWWLVLPMAFVLTAVALVAAALVAFRMADSVPAVR